MKFSDAEIATELYRTIMEEASRVNSGINIIYFVQSLSSEPVSSVERSLKFMINVLTPKIL